MPVDGIRSAVPHLPAVQVDAAHPGLGGEWHEGRAQSLYVPLADTVLLLGQDDDAPTLGGFVGKRGELSHVGEVALRDSGGRKEGGGLAVAERDGSGLV